MKPWLLGNTTVRSPFRLRDGLVAISTSPLQGNLRGKENEVALRALLGAHKIVELGDDVTYSVGRKWRSVLNKLGFLYPLVPKSLGIEQKGIGQADMITPNGWRLIKAETVPAMQECFLRALAAHFIPSPLENDYSFNVFSPLRHTLAVMLELERQTKKSSLSFIEMALIVQLSSLDDGIANIVARVLNLRTRRASAANKRLFDQQERNATASQSGYVEGTFNDYSDTNFRYLKATGLVQSAGRSITLSPTKHVFIERLVQDNETPESPQAFFNGLCNGAILPTDSNDSARAVLSDLIRQLQDRSIPFDIADRTMETPADIELVRYYIEDLISKRDEEEYAARQAKEWEEIAAFMQLLITQRKKMTLPCGEEIEIPVSEAPAYFEWVLWRAFLAINNLTNTPYSARRFKIDQDFLPVGTAPGGGPDLIFEFEDYVLVVEVTLTTNSRQEAVEGEPVRRHVANLVLEYQRVSAKPVYGLFIANKIDSNTAETFRIGVWYTNDDIRMRLDIAPLTLASFKSFFEAMFISERVKVGLVRELVEQCVELREEHQAPEWKKEICRAVQNRVSLFSQAQ
jgi:hypothetical protein